MGVGEQAVGAEFAIEVDDDGSDVGGADGGVREEAMFPLAQQHYALVQGEETGEVADEVGRDGVEFTGEVAS